MIFLLKQRLWVIVTKRIIPILFCFFFLFLFSQSNPKAVDSLLKESKREARNFNFNKSILLSKKALEASKTIFYKEGIIKSNYQIALNLCNLGNYDESFKYIKIIEKDDPDYIKNNFEFHIELLDVKGRNYLAQGFKNQAKEEFRKEVNLSYLHKDLEKKYSRIIHSYINLSASCDYDSAYFYSKKILLLKDKVKDKEGVFINYLSLADLFYKEKNINIDSALHYNNKGILLAKEYNSTYLYIGILQKAELLFLQKKHTESIKYTLEGLALSKERNRSEEVLLSYKLLADNYKNLGDYKKQSKFLDKYSKMNDSIFKARQAGIYASADMIFDEQNKKESSRNSFLWYILSIILVIISGVFFYFKKNKKLIENVTPTNTEIETKAETELPAISYDEIIALAKSNSSDFLFRFKETSPHFFDKLLEIDPELITSELTFCAYLKLHFSTKEIATYTFVTPKAVQNRKNRIRKKLNIPSDMDIYIWMDNL